jgi:hypothetical protein
MARDQKEERSENGGKEKRKLDASHKERERNERRMARKERRIKGKTERGKKH